MNINIIITCYDRVDHLKWLLDIIASWKTISPVVLVCASSPKAAHYANILAPNPGHHTGDAMLAKFGFEFFRSCNSGPRFLKLCADTWPCREEKVIEIFNRIESCQCAYGGNKWFSRPERIPSLATDIFFADIRYGNVFDYKIRPELEFEEMLFKHVVKEDLKQLEIVERAKLNLPEERFECAELGWTMQHDLGKQLENMNKFISEPLAK